MFLSLLSFIGLNREKNTSCAVSNILASTYRAHKGVFRFWNSEKISGNKIVGFKKREIYYMKQILNFALENSMKYFYIGVPHWLPIKPLPHMIASCFEFAKKFQKQHDPIVESPNLYLYILTEDLSILLELYSNH